EELIKIARENECYKVILDCNEKVMEFYEKMGFRKHAIMMRIDILRCQYWRKFFISIYIVISMENETLDLKNRPLERIFQNSIARIIDFFIINQNFNFSTSEISELSDVPLRTIQRIIPQLVEKEIIKEVKRSKKNKAYELN